MHVHPDSFPVAAWPAAHDVDDCLAGCRGRKVLVGASVFEHDGTLRWAHDERAAWGMAPVAVDLDRDGAREVLLGASWFRADGTLVFESDALRPKIAPNV